MEDILGIHKIDIGLGAAGVGWVVIPDGADREQYIEDCYKTNTLTISAGFGYSFFSNVPTDQEVMQNIVFPEGETNRGSAVVWVKDEISDSPIIVASLRQQDDYYVLNNNQYRIARETSETSVEAFVDGTTSTLLINVVGSDINPSKINVKLVSKNKNSIFNLSSDNEVVVNATNKATLNTNSEIVIQVEKEGEVKTTISYKQEEGFHYKDEFDNEITAKDGEIDIKSDKINHNEGKEPMVLGDTLADLLKDLCKALQALTVNTSVGPSSVPTNVADFVTIQSKIDNIKSQKSNLE